MYESHWGMHNTPFQACDVRRFYESPTHEEAMARLLFLIEHHRRLGILTGLYGSGKTIVLGMIAKSVRAQGGVVAQIHMPGMDRHDFLIQLANQLGMNVRPTEKPLVLWRGIVDRIAQYRYDQMNTVVLIDDMDRANQEMQWQIARLAQHDWSPEARLTLILTSRRERRATLDRTLWELAELRIDLEPLDPADTDAYIKASLAQAGCRTEVFDEPALARLHELTHGIPRRIDQLADLALVAGAGQKLDHIDAQMIDAIYQELQTGRL